ncbi:hypothetical protein JWG43_00995 [Desulfobulbus alkaliphilus]|nr:hypothetical protein [Desulfobulbus alkaliphilus]
MPGFKEEESTAMPFDMVVINDLLLIECNM